ncbi:MAG: transposase [Spirosomataceae bacterium]|jgi:putative transposase
MAAGTYSQVYIQVVFAVKGKQNLMQKAWRKELHKYISGIITNKRNKAIIGNGVGDHIHYFIGLKSSIAIFDLVRDIKSNSSKFVNEQNFVRGKFEWQTGYGVFSYAQSQVKSVYNYIFNQEEHHKTKTFKEEYIEFLVRFEIDYNPDYLFGWIQ